MNSEQKQPDNAKVSSKLEIIYGFIGAIVVNGLIMIGLDAWIKNLMANNVQATGMEIIIFCLLPLVNLVALSILSWKRRSIAIGMVIALTLAVIIVLTLALLRFV